MKTQPQHPPLRVLVVDDDPIAREVAGMWLDELGYESAFAESAADALAKLDQRPFDVLFTDVHLQDNPDGFQLSVAAIDRQPRIRALFVSALAWGHHQRDEPGTTFLHKPYTKLELARALEFNLQA
jgi:CheY-like chemotaxis protein